jgi:hypothetical protein
MDKLSCKPRRQGDQLACHVCGRAWDLNEQAPEQCVPVARRASNDPLASVKTLLGAEVRRGGRR